MIVFLVNYIREKDFLYERNNFLKEIVCLFYFVY